MDEAALDRVGEGLIADPLVPVFSRQLTRHDGGSRTVAVLEDLEQVVALRVSRMADTKLSMIKSWARASLRSVLA